MNLEFTLDNLFDDIFSGVEPEQIHNLLIVGCDTIVPASPTTSILVLSSNIFSITLSLPNSYITIFDYSKNGSCSFYCSFYWCYDLYRAPQLPSLVMTQPCSVLLFAKMVSVLPRTSSISLLKSSHYVISIVFISFVILSISNMLT